jgi:hypothetical protein
MWGTVAALNVSHLGGPHFPKMNSDYVCELGLGARTERVIELRFSFSPSEFELLLV